MYRFIRSLAAVGFGLSLLVVSGCGGGKGFVASNHNGAKEAAALATPASEGIKLARGGRKGTLDISSNPSGARIFLDNQDTGRVTPAVIKKVAAGPHDLRLVLGNAVYVEDDVIVNAGRRTRRFISPLQQPTVNFITVSPRVLNANGGSVVFEVSAVQAGIASLTVQLTITRTTSTGGPENVATLVLAQQSNNLYVGSFSFPANLSTTTPATYHLSFSISNGVTQPSIIAGGDVVVQPDADTPPPFPPL